MWKQAVRGMQIINVSRYAIVGFGVFMGVLAIILQEIGLSLGWVYLFMVYPSSPHTAGGLLLLLF